MNLYFTDKTAKKQQTMNNKSPFRNR